VIDDGPFVSVIIWYVRFLRYGQRSACGGSECMQSACKVFSENIGGS
jgi:hypothetical protein